MKILITGAKGFVGRNLIAELKAQNNFDLYEFDIDTEKDLLKNYTRKCDFVFHLAGVNRPKQNKEFIDGNVGFTSLLIEYLKFNNNKAPVLVTSSIQASKNNPYGLSKKAGEDLLFSYSQAHNVPVYIYRLPNLFGKWSRPNYNTVIATFCYNISRGIDIQINNPNTILRLCYIDDVLDEFKRALNNFPTFDMNGFCSVPVEHSISMGDLAEILKSFKSSRTELSVPDNSNPLIKKLYSTYLSFIPEHEFSYDLTMHEDLRGSFTEFIRTPERGQISINISKSGITKGNHWHHTKNEKFLVVSGGGVIRFRQINGGEIIEYLVSGKKLQVVDIPIGYSHSIENTGDTDMVTVMWANEVFNPNHPDTYFEEV